jgi:hypothetical protein
MELNPQLDSKIRDYLLGILPEAEQEPLEEQLLIDESIFGHILVKEDELIDDYLQGALSKQEKEAFEKHFLAASERQKKLCFARALSKSIASSTASKKENRLDWILQSMRRLWPAPVTLPSYVMAAIMLLLGISLFGIALRLQVMQRETDQLRGKQVSALQLEQDLRQQLDQANSRNRTLAEELQEQPNTPEGQTRAFQPPLSLAFSLSPGLVRDLDALKTVEIPRNVKFVELNLHIMEAEKYDLYRAVLLTINGDEVAIQNRLYFKTRGSQQIATLAIPSSLLLPGDYLIRLLGVRTPDSPENIGKYYFRVSRK